MYNGLATARRKIKRSDALSHCLPRNDNGVEEKARPPSVPGPHVLPLLFSYDLTDGLNLPPSTRVVAPMTTGTEQLPTTPTTTAMAHILASTSPGGLATTPVAFAPTPAAAGTTTPGGAAVGSAGAAGVEGVGSFNQHDGGRSAGAAATTPIAAGAAAGNEVDDADLALADLFGVSDSVDELGGQDLQALLASEGDPSALFNSMTGFAEF